MLNLLIFALHCYPYVQLNTQPPLSLSLFRKDFTKLSDVYNRLGQFDYGQQSCTTDHITCINKENDWIYIGEVKEEGTDDTPHGIGIKVNKYGDIEEGYWKDGKLHGRGRTISWGVYYIGEYKEGKNDGDGTAYFNNGDKEFEGEFKNGKPNGQGTLYRFGNKYATKWDKINRELIEIDYEDGTKYTGLWEWDKDDSCKIKRHGLGTLFSADGQVLNQGNWDMDKYVENE